MVTIAVGCRVPAVESSDYEMELCQGRDSIQPLYLMMRTLGKSKFGCQSLFHLHCLDGSVIDDRPIRAYR